MNIQLINLKTKTADLFARIDEERTRLKTRIEDLNSPANRKKYVAAHVDEEIKATKQKAKEVAVLFQAELATLEAGIAAATAVWETDALMRRAKFTPDDATEIGQVLGELRKMNLTAEIKAAAPDELVAMITDAAESGRLAELALIRKEVGRRDFGDSVVRMSVNTALSEAVAGLEIPGQPQAKKAIEEATLTLEAARDVAHELATGDEPVRARMARVMAEQAARRDEQAA
jgi:hypothetical protein